MHLKNVTLTDFRSFEELEWEIGVEEGAGWHVLLGTNGSGKSSVLQAIAMALIGPQEFLAARPDLPGLVRRDTEGQRAAAASVALQVSGATTWDPVFADDGKFGGAIEVQLAPSESGAWSIGEPVKWPASGWFSASFGPMRRLFGRSEIPQSIARSFPRLAQHLTLFDDDVALGDTVEWLKSLRFRVLDAKERQGKSSGKQSALASEFLTDVKSFINQPDFLPYGVQLVDIDSDGVTFKDGNGVELPLRELSAGYHAVLSLTFEVIRLMSDAFNGKRIFNKAATQVDAPGVVMIDEVDVHLHPAWQRDIGPCLTRMFPNVQFIVTTHSPLICQAAVKGSVWKLAAPGEAVGIQRIEGEQLQRVLYGDVLHALNSEAFGGIPGRSDVALAKMRRFAELNQLAQAGKLKEPARLEQEALRKELEGVLPGWGQ
jgi:hypothetical protein